MAYLHKPVSPAAPSCSRSGYAETSRNNKNEERAMTIRVELEVEKGRKPSEQQNTPRTLSISLLGTFRVELCGKPVPRFYRKMQALLAYLAAHPDQPFRRETLAELLWPDLPADSARQNLRRALANLREVLADNDEDSRCSSPRRISSALRHPRACGSI